MQERARRVRVIKLTQTREITPYLWVHPDEERGAPPGSRPAGFLFGAIVISRSA
jgi:hypothetical protein